MPIEIKELHIRIAVNTAGGGQLSRPSGASTVAIGGFPLDEEGKNALVAECVEQVLHIFENKKER
jgi:hypothetical protein